MKKTVKIPEELRDYIEALHYDVKSRQDLLSFVIEKGLDSNTESFAKYHNEYKEFFVMYEEAKEDLERTYIKPLLGENQRADWELNFSESELVISIQ